MANKKQAPAKGGEKSKGGGEKTKGGEKSGKLSTCNQVKGRHILCEKQSRILEAQQKLEALGSKVSPAEFGKVAAEYSECPSGKKGGDLGWFPRGKMVGPFQDVAFATSVGEVSQPFKTVHGYHIFLCEGRKA